MLTEFQADYLIGGSIREKSRINERNLEWSQPEWKI